MIRLRTLISVLEVSSSNSYSQRTLLFPTSSKWILGLEPVRNYRAKRPKGRSPLLQKNLEQKLADMRYKDPAIHFKVDIGYKLGTPGRKDVFSERLEQYLKNKSNREMELAAKHRKLQVNLEDVHGEWEKTEGPAQIKGAAEYYGVYESLFEDAYFTPVLPLNISYNYGGKEELESVVYRGNLIKPLEAKEKPTVSYQANPDDLFTLLMTSPDCHFEKENGEYVHWLVGNIPGSDISKGQELCDYLQPFPPRGVGYCRYVFVLFKQEKKIDFSGYQREPNCTNLSARDFYTYEFYKKFQDDMTPAGLAFFQSDWDQSLTPFFHDVLGMKEPVFEYDFEPFNLPRQEWFPFRKPFDIYLDKYKDPKELQKELLIEKLKERHPFQPPPPRPKYPLIFKIKSGTPTWLKDDMKRKRAREGKWKFMDI